MGWGTALSIAAPLIGSALGGRKGAGTTSSTKVDYTDTTGLVDPTVLSPVLNRIPGQVDRAFQNYEQSPYFNQQSAIALGGRDQNLDNLIQELMLSNTLPGYAAASNRAYEDFTAGANSLAHLRGGYSDTNSGLTTGQDRLTDLHNQNLFNIFDRTQNQRTNLIANLLSQQNAQEMDRFNQLGNLDTRQITGGLSILGNTSNTLATLPLATKTRRKGITGATNSQQLAAPFRQELGATVAGGLGQLGDYFNNRNIQTQAPYATNRYLPQWGASSSGL